ncbi:MULTISPECIES: phage tail tape measure protein [Chryseobacterium]|uniref:Phage tail tape measure protein n=1 Tax=Candidatus Chryseobacterium massiliense TaxID=204089 RepID=A0A3D9B2M0_9FLAO|nr:MULTISPECIES: phage tail tape measure protein [Chryseobacterium]REC47875.1 phage tail tape measure protein [Candidatus Chryseobacterium massiliae]
MSTATTTWVLKISENIIPKFKSVGSEGAKAGEKIDASFEKVGDELTKTKKKVDSLNNAFKKTSATDWRSVGDGIDALNSRLQDAVKPGADFNAAFHELKGLTGATDEQMQKMSTSARELSKEFGGSSAGQMNSYQSILGKLGPEIAQNDEALAKMGRNVAVMSKTMKNDMGGATEALTNSMIQFKTDLSDPMKAAEEMDRMMNVMVASAKAGSVEVPEISKALSEAGGVAKMSNLTFEETNALIQGMAKGGVESGKLGVAARNAILKMAAPATLSDDATKYLKAYGVDIGKISDTTIPFIDRLKELQKVGHDMNALALIFGTENVQGAQAMLSTIKYQEDLTKQVTGTKDAYDMAGENMKSWNEKMARYKANIEDFKVGLFDSIAPVTAFTETATEAIKVGTDIGAVYSGIADPIKSFAKWTKDVGLAQKFTSFWTGVSTFAQNAFNKTMNWGPIKNMVTWLKNTALAQKLVSAWTGIATAAQWAWNAALTANPIGLIIVGIAALIAFVALAIAKWDQWGATFILMLGPIGLIISAFKNIYDKWDSIKKAFQDGGIIGGLKRIGVVLLDVLLKPIQQIAGWLDSIFGTNLESGMKKLRGQMDLLDDKEKKDLKGIQDKEHSDAIKKDLASGKLVMYNGNPVTKATQERLHKRDIERDMKSGKLVMYNGQAVLPSTKAAAEKRAKQEKKDSAPKLLSPDSVLAHDKEKKKKKKKGKGEGETSVGGNGAGVKTINVTVNMHNHFSIDKSYGSIEKAANNIISKINDRMADSMVALD